MRFDRDKFFAGYRGAFGGLNQSQVDGLSFLLNKLEQDSFSLKQTAYILATVDHETAHTFQPIKERRGRSLTDDQKKYWPSGYYGRGYVQITWERNYAKFGIADTPETALEPETAYTILSRGMREGLFTGKKLSDSINGKADYVNARKIVNGLDKARQIAANAQKFESILTAASQSKIQPLVDAGEVKATATVTVVAEEPKPTDPKEQGVVAGIKTHVASAVSFLTAAGAGLISWVQGASTPLILGFFGAAALIGVTYIISRNWIRNKENQRLAEVQLEREKMAHEITLLKMKSAMDSKALTVEVEHVEDVAPREEPKE